MDATIFNLMFQLMAVRLSSLIWSLLAIFLVNVLVSELFLNGHVYLHEFTRLHATIKTLPTYMLFL